MQISQVLLFLFTFSVVVVHSTKVIYVNFEDHKNFLVHHGGIIHVPGEKPKCKDRRTPDRTGNCRKIVEF